MAAAVFLTVARLGRQAKEMLLKWESDDPDVRNLWETMNNWVFDGFNETYKTLGVEVQMHLKRGFGNDKCSSIIFKRKVKLIFSEKIWPKKDMKMVTS